MRYHGVGGESRPQNHDGRVLNVLDIAKEIIRVQSDIENRTTVRKLGDKSLGLRSPLIVIRGEEFLSTIFSGILNVRSCAVILVRIRARDEYRT